MDYYDLQQDLIAKTCSHLETNTTTQTQRKKYIENARENHKIGKKIKSLIQKRDELKISGRENLNKIELGKLNKKIKTKRGNKRYRN